VSGSSPNFWSNWELWRKAGLTGMAAGGRLAAAKVGQAAAQHALSVSTALQTLYVQRC
jgi:hypothetical protein